MQTIRPRSIPSVQPTLRGGGRFDLSPYEKKIAELHDEVSKEAKLLQDVRELKESELKEIALLRERKAQNTILNFRLEGEINLSKEELETTIETKGKFLNESERELREKIEEEKMLKGSIEELKKNAEEMGSVVGELQTFIERENQAREKWLSEQEKLSKAKTERLEISQKNEKEEAELLVRNKEFDVYKEKMKDFYGKIATYVVVARETIKQVNEALEKNTPIRFQLPPNEKELKVYFDSFNKYL